MRTLVWSFFAMTAMTACQQSLSEEKVSDELQMSLVASIGSPNNTVTSRYAGIDPNSVNFEEGDDIGLFIDDKPALKWVFSNQKWNPDNIVYWTDKNQNHTFNAFYPYQEASAVTEVPMPSLLEQTGMMENLDNYDFLVASVSQSYGDNGVVEFCGNYSFKHVSSLLQLTLEAGGDVDNSTITGITVNGADIVASSTYSFKDGKVNLTRDENSDELTVPLSYKMNGEDVSFYLMVNEKLDPATVVTLSISYTTGEKNYVAEMTNFAGNTFVGGARQHYSLTIKDSSLKITGSSISSWDEGEALDNLIIDGQEEQE